MPLTIATWNVQNLALPNGATSAAFAQKLKRIVATLAAVNADVIALQEILDRNAAEQIASALNRLRGTPAYVAVNGQPDRRDNRVAFVSRLPVVETESLTAWQLPPGECVMRLDRVAGKLVTVPEPTLPRPPLRIRVRLVDGTSVDVINVHLKSKLIAFPGGGFSTHDEALRALATELTLQRRTAEALTVRAHVDHLLAEDRPVVVLGDFNDEPGAATTQIVCERLFNLTQWLPADVRWSRKRDEQREMLDQILVSEGLMQHPNVHVLNDDVPNGASDHALVHATFPALS